MSKRSKSDPSRPRKARPEAQPGPGEKPDTTHAMQPSWWTADFARPRFAIVVAAILGLYSLIMFVFLAYDVMAADRAAVLWSAGCIIGLGIIHPAFALAFLAFVRHWLDGMTYPADNVYFLWGILFLFALWAVRLLFRGGRIEFRTPALLIGGFVVVAFLTAFDTVQYENSFNSLLMWCSYLALFILAANTLRTPLALAIALGGVIAAFYAQSAYSILHYDYVLPYVRKMILEDPNLLRQYFNTDVLTPDLAHRLARNRAFGTMLFPNALAALLILGIPTCLFGLWYQWRLFSDTKPSREASGLPLVATALGAWLITLVFNFAVVWFHSVFSYPEDSFIQHPLPWFGGVGLVPLVAAACMVAVARKKGLIQAWRLAASIALGITAIAASIALFLSKSRGGMLALVVALVFSALLIYLAHRRAQGGLPAFLQRLFGTPQGTAPPEAPSVRRDTAHRSVNLPVLLRTATAMALIAVLGFLTLTAIPVAAQDPAPGAADAANTAPLQAAPKPPPQITEAGVDLEFSELLRLSTLSIRLTYWNVAIRMAWDNLFTGVGIGNFGVAYPKYQYLGAGDVQTAHNDYLQYLAETGVFGFLFFCAFALWFILWGARRIVREPVPMERWMLAGLYGGVLAFLLHSFVDFNFNNPALVFFFMLLAGAFCARAAKTTAIAAPHTGADTAHRAMALPALLLVALLFGFSARAYYQDFVISKNEDGASWLNVGNFKTLDRRYAVGNFFLADNIYIHRQKKQGEQVQPPIIPVEAALLFLHTRDELEKAGELRVPVAGSPTGSRQVNRSERIPPNAFLIVTVHWEAYVAAHENALPWVQRLVAVDSVFPHSPELADHIAQWYALLRTNLPTMWRDRRDPYQRQEILWRREAVERSPLQPGYHIALAQALWNYAERRSDAGRLDFYDEGFEHYNKALEIYPISVEVNSAYATALHFMAYVSKRLGNSEQAAAFTQRFEEQQAFIERLVAARAKVGLP